MTRGEYGLLIDYEYCSGCHACEVACKKEHEMPKGDFGIKILKDGPRQSSDGVWEFDYIVRSSLPSRRHGLRNARGTRR